MTSSSRHQLRAFAWVGTIALGVSASLALSSCGFSCTEIGYRNELRITAVGAGAEAITDILLCAGDICAYPSQDAAPVTGRSYWVTHATPGLWVYDFGDHHPDTVQLTLIDSSGGQIRQQEYRIDWVLIDEPNGPGCGWRAEPFELTLDA
ncbi:MULTISPECIES: hypothetical protein [unclassified Rathayibacter]|uniref:hypothetical protein n=1 Tax=unclassified Rathayibacter TaxID=2609250 RepID=UPI00188AC70D|nr:MULTISPECIES: hypothetical protein [unclassified Rathayibacter]MBF4462274.1 hypothetical protein [Rathayibacter sp. VKM Ac-2879]MBF4503683.1 hypothetical protein [Rathayibacter sp. VKM Ac-2878]